MEHQQIITVVIGAVQIIGIPIALFIIKYVRKGYYANKYTSMQTEAIVFTMEKHYGNGFGECYRSKLQELREREKFVKEQSEL